MSRLLRVLLVEDSEDDALLLLRQLQQGDYDVKAERVETAPAMKKALQKAHDIVLAEYSLPNFSALAALKLVKETGQDLPLIIVSSHIGEEFAVAAMKAGAHDYLMKSNLARLVPAVERELREAAVRRDRQRAESETRLLQQLIHSVMDLDDSHAALAVALRQVCQNTGWDYGEAWIPNSDETLLQWSTAWHSGHNQLEEFRSCREKYTFAPGIGVAGRVWVTKKPEWYRDISSEPHNIIPCAPVLKEYKLKVALGIPIMAGDRVLSVLVFLMFADREEDKRMIELVSAVATQLGSLMQRKLTTAALKASEQRFRSLIENASDIILILDSQGVLTYVSPSVKRILGYTPEKVLGKNILKFVCSDEVPKVLCAMEQALAQPRISQAPILLKVKESNGNKCILEAVATNLLDDPAVQGLVVNCHDITKRKQAEEQLRRYAFYDSLTELPNRALFLERLGQLCEIAKQDGESELRLRKKTIRLQGRIKTKPVNQTYEREDKEDKKDQEKYLLLSTTNDHNQQEETGKLSIVGFPLSKQDYPPVSSPLFAVLFLDLDRFQIIKYSLGHLVADQLLIATAQRLIKVLNPELPPSLTIQEGRINERNQTRSTTELIARVGIDEFAILLTDIWEISEINEIADNIHTCFAVPFNLDGHEVFTTASIGIALSNTGYDRPEDFLRSADTALHHAKQQGTQPRSVLFDISMHARAIAGLQLETDLRRAIERQEFVLHYHPIVSLITGKAIGFEALVRWSHPQIGMVSPDAFIPLAEETGLILPLGAWVLREACRQMVKWQQQFPEFDLLTMSVNLAGLQLAESNLMEQIDRILQETGLPGNRLKLELTESILMKTAEATHLLKQLKSRDIQLSIDDFGTGYSSLSRLHQWPLDTLKIDRSFISRLGMAEESSALVRTIVSLADNLGLQVIAEGVETAEQAYQLWALQCEAAQGYFFSKPLPSEAATKWMTDKLNYKNISG